MADEQVLLPRGRYESLLKKIGSDKEPLVKNEEKNLLVREEKKSPRMEPVKTEVEPRLKSPVKPPVKSAEKKPVKKPVKQKRPIQKPPGIPAMSFDWIRF